MQFNSYLPSRLIFGIGALDELHKQKLPGQKALIVITAGGSMSRLGFLARLQKQLILAGVEYIVYDKIQPNPVMQQVREGTELIKKEGCDMVIGLGGGSSMDSAKAMAIAATNKGDYWDYVTKGSGKGHPMEHCPLKVIAIPSTAGSGSEVTPWMVITHEGQKIGFGNNLTYPFLALVDPSLTFSLPPQLTAFQGFDALFHSIESYLTTLSNPISELYALRAVELLGRSLPTVVNSGPDTTARTDVSLAATLAGMAISTTGCTSLHPMEHSLSAYRPLIPHGAGLIMLSLAYFEFFLSKQACAERFARLSQALGAPPSAAYFLDTLKQLEKACGVDNLKMSEYGINKEDLFSCMQNTRLLIGHRFAKDRYVLSDEEILTIMERSWR